MKLTPTLIPGCFEIAFTPRADARGSFVKSFQATAFRELGLEANFTESFYSVSNAGVLRGMHFQLPPADGAKLVFCLQGTVLDAALDLRVGSPSYAQHTTFELSGNKPTAAYIPRGVAHGFLTLAGPATLVYMVSSEYHPDLDTGVLWNSFQLAWPHPQPLCSPRDATFPSLQAFQSPFRFSPSEVDV